MVWGGLFYLGRGVCLLGGSTSRWAMGTVSIFGWRIGLAWDLCLIFFPKLFRLAVFKLSLVKDCYVGEDGFVSWVVFLEGGCLCSST